MPDTADLKSKPNATREAADKQALAQVEKWMAIIREISRERQGRSVLSG